MRIPLAGLFLAAGILGPGPAPETKPPEPYAALAYRFIGPPGNRVSAVTGVPGDPNTYYAGGASGGVWKSTDAGVHWRPIFDKEPAQSIGSIAIAPSDPNIVWVGTGETFIRSNVSLGNGIYKSTDAGRTWTHMGLEKTGRIGRVIIDPRNPDVVFAAALGTCYGPQQERGIYRTMDGGKTWERVLFVDENTGASDLSMDASNPRILFAGTWQIDIKTWGRKSGGPGSGVFVSKDGGTTWKRIEKHGLPDPPLGKIAINVAPSDGQRVYALIETGQKGSLWRSDDGGENWKLVNASRLLNERPHYYTRMLVMPDNANEVYFPSNGMGATWDGGETSEQVRWGGDNHDMWADPKDPRRMMIGNDGGVIISTTRGRQWNSMRLPIGQIYHVTADNRIPYMVYGQMQDDGSMRGPSNSRGGGGISPALWTSTAGCETGWATPDPVDPDIVWGGCYAGVVERWNAKTGMSRSVSPWPERTMGANAGEVRLRINWTFPIAISPHDHNTVYVGSQNIQSTSDGGQTWKAISPDLTLERQEHAWRLGRPDGRQPVGRVRGRRLFDCRIAQGEGRHLGRHQRRRRPGHAGRRPALGRTSRPGSRVFRRRARSTASIRRLSTEEPVTSPSICTRWTTAIPSSSRRPTTARPGRRSPRTSRRARSRTSTSCARTRTAKDCSTPARKTRSTCPSTTAGTGNSSRASCRTLPSTGCSFSRTSTISWSAPMAAASTSWTT